MNVSLDNLKVVLRSQESLILIMNDTIAKRVAVAWKIYRPSFKEGTGKIGETPYEAIARLWEGIGAVDFNRLAMIAGLPITKVTKAFERLRASNLIWPDGTMSDEARKIIVGDINVYLMPMIPKSVPPKPEKGNKDDGKQSNRTHEKTSRQARGAHSRPKARADSA